MSAKVRFFTGDLFTTASASDTDLSKLYEKNTSKNYYFKTADTSIKSNKTYYIFKPQSAAVTNHADGNIYFGIDTTNKVSSIFVDKADGNGTITTYRVGLDDTLLAKAANYAVKADNDGIGNSIADTYLTSVTAACGTTGIITFTEVFGSDKELLINGNKPTVTIPAASTSSYGLITTAEQTLGGKKIFNNGVEVKSSSGFNYSAITTSSNDSSNGTSYNLWGSTSASKGVPVQLGGISYSTKTGLLSASITGNAATATTASSTAGTLTIKGSSSDTALGTFDGSGNVTVTISASNLGLQNALRFAGVASAAPTVGGTGAVTIASKSYTPTTGDVILVSGTTKEFVYTTSGWQEFGDEGTHVKTSDPRVKTLSPAMTTGLAVASFTFVPEGNSTKTSDTIYISYADGNTEGVVSNTTQTFNGAKTFANNVTISGTLGVTGKTTLSSGLDVSGATSLKSTLGVTGKTTLSAGLDVSGATKISNTLTVDGNYKTTLGGALEVAGATALKSTLSVTDTSTFTKLATFNGKIFSADGTDSAYSKDDKASIVTDGGISAAGQVSAKTVRIDDNAATATGHGCIMQYNSTQACLEFTFA